MDFTPVGYVTHSEGKRYIEVDKTNNKRCQQYGNILNKYF